MNTFRFVRAAAASFLLTGFMATTSLSAQTFTQVFGTDGGLQATASANGFGLLHRDNRGLQYTGTDLAGEMLTAYQLQGSTEAQVSALCLRDGNLLIMNDNGQLTKSDTKGNALWTSACERVPGMITGIRLFEVTDLGFVAAVGTNAGETRLFGLNKSGQTLWTKSVQGANVCIAVSEGGNIWANGRNLLRIHAADGTIIKSAPAIAAAEALVATADGGLIAARPAAYNGITFTAYDPTAMPLWTAELPTNDEAKKHITDLGLTADGHLVAAIHFDESFSPACTMLYTFDKSGRALNTVRTEYNITDIAACTDGTFILTGTAFNPIEQAEQTILAKTDANFTFAPLNLPAELLELMGVPAATPAAQLDDDINAKEKERRERK